MLFPKYGLIRSVNEISCSKNIKLGWEEIWYYENWEFKKLQSKQMQK